MFGLIVFKNRCWRSSIFYIVCLICAISLSYLREQNTRKEEVLFMIEIDIPSIDPIQHEPKIFFGMTSRQCICIVPGVALGVGLFMLTYGINQDLAIISCGLAVAPAVCLGWVSPYNMKFEQYLRLLWFNTFVSNPKRIYKTDNEQEVKLLTIKERQELEKKQKAQEIEEKKKSKKNKKSGKKEL